MIYNYAPMKDKNLFIKICYEAGYDIQLCPDERQKIIY